MAQKAKLTIGDLKNYPYVSYEQGEHSSSFFAEEITVTDSPKQVEVSDRASLMNLLLSTDSYVLGTGIMPSVLNQDRIVSIPFESDDHYLIGSVLRADRNISKEEFDWYFESVRRSAEASAKLGGKLLATLRVL